MAQSSYWRATCQPSARQLPSLGRGLSEAKKACKWRRARHVCGRGLALRARMGAADLLAAGTCRCAFDIEPALAKSARRLDSTGRGISALELAAGEAGVNPFWPEARDVQTNVTRALPNVGKDGNAKASARCLWDCRAGELQGARCRNEKAPRSRISVKKRLASMPRPNGQPFCAKTWGIRNREWRWLVLAAAMRIAPRAGYQEYGLEHD